MAVPKGDCDLLGQSVPPSSRAQLGWLSPQSFGGCQSAAPVGVPDGSTEGPVFCLRAALHGGELNGIEIACRVAHRRDPEPLSRTLVSLPIVNLEGFVRHDRYIGDRRDLSRSFPGDPDGAYPARIADALMRDIIRHCDALADLHIGSFYRENLPQICADLTVPELAALDEGFYGLSVLQSVAPKGSLHGAAVAEGVPAVMFEAGAALTVDMAQVEAAVISNIGAMQHVGMIPGVIKAQPARPAFFKSRWVRAPASGIFISDVARSAWVEIDQRNGAVLDPITSSQAEICAPLSGTVSELAQNQFVSPGFALYRLGQRATQDELDSDGEALKQQIRDKARDGLTVPADSQVLPED
ncbi:MAG: succinylglutamate desuccinylase/aspartoacylase family protein [Rhodobacteraceae bacterium]|nr:succinylglutamate desuccinylase/aspartoacylase family protein [Paracoccaceae bacterium]